MEVDRLVQDDNATVDEIVGCHLGSFKCIFGYDDEDGSPYPNIFLIETQENSNWHRIFLEAGICFWDLYKKFPDHDVEYEPDLFPICELVRGSDLEGAEIVAAVVTPYHQGCKVQITFSGGKTFEASIRTCTNEDEAVAVLAGKPLKLKQAEQGGAGQPATRSESK